MPFGILVTPYLLLATTGIICTIVNMMWISLDYRHLPHDGFSRPTALHGIVLHAMLCCAMTGHIVLSMTSYTWVNVLICWSLVLAAASSLTWRSIVWNKIKVSA